MDSVGKGEGGKIWENGIETCNIMYETNKQKKDLLRLYLVEFQRDKAPCSLLPLPPS